MPVQQKKKKKKKLYLDIYQPACYLQGLHDSEQCCISPFMAWVIYRYKYVSFLGSLSIDKNIIKSCFNASSFLVRQEPSSENTIFITQMWVSKEYFQCETRNKPFD
jgi:hypothetical protein